MMTSDFIVDVTEADFEYEVIKYSLNTPVVVDFWAEWCKPCKTLSPLLENLAHEANGRFRLARVDVDANPNLALRYSVRSIPTVKGFSQGQVVGEFVGLQPEGRIREFLSHILPPDETSLAIEKAESLLSAHEWHEADALLRELQTEQPENPAVLFNLSKALLGTGKAQEARFILRNFPASKLYNEAEIIRPLAEALVEYQQNQLATDSDLDIMFNSSIRLANRGNFEAALDGLLEIIRQDKRYANGRARLVFLGILEILGEDDPDTRQYRSELAMLLF